MYPIEQERRHSKPSQVPLAFHSATRVRNQLHAIAQRLFDPWIYTQQVDDRQFTEHDVVQLFQKFSNTSVRFVLGVNEVQMIEEPDSTDLDRRRAENFKGVLERLQGEKALPSGITFVMNVHDYPQHHQDVIGLSQPPLFSFCPSVGFADLPVVHNEMMNYDPSLAAETRRQNPWSERLDTAYWRGSTTGGWYTLDNWPEKPRTILTNISRHRPDVVDAAFVRCAQCDPGVWEQLQSAGLCQDSGAYPGAGDLRARKFLVDIDGNACSFRFISLLGHGSVVFKVQPKYTEWFDSLILPYVHYIPIREDMSDLVDKLLWARRHDQEMERVSKAALEAYDMLIYERTWEDYLTEVLEKYQQLF